MHARGVFNICLLSLAYALGIVMLFANVFVSPLASVYLTEGNAVSRLQTVPLFVLIGCSAFVIPLCGIFFSCLQGYKAVFVVGALTGLLGSLLCFVAVYWGGPGMTWAFALLVIGCGLQGLAYGVIHFYRHTAATELSSETFRPWAIAIVLSGGIVAGILGPQIGSWTIDLMAKKFAGTYAVLSGIFLAHVIVVACVQLPRPSMPTSGEGARPLLKIVASLPFLRSVVPALSFHATMVGLMSLCPEIAKTLYGVTAAADIITVHVVCMYLPSLLVPIALKYIRHELIITAGAILVGVGFGTFTQGDGNVIFFYVAMSFLGIGWNLAFVSSTALMNSAINHPAERFKVQATNDTIVFGVGSVVTLLSGVLLASIGVVPILIFSGCWVFLILLLSWYMSVVSARRLAVPPAQNMQETEQLIK